MPRTVEDFRKQVQAVIQDDAQSLDDSTIDGFVKQAVMQRYSQDRPQVLVDDLAGDGSYDLTLPTHPSTLEKYEDKFSVIQEVEYPIGVNPRNLVLGTDFEILRTPTGLKLRILSTAISLGTSARVTWTARHLDNLQTVPDSDFYAVCDFAASLGLEALAAKKAQTQDNTSQADVVNYRSKSSEYLALAKAARKRYFDFIGIPESLPGGAAERGPALAVGDMDNVMGSGLDRMIHGKYSR
jgi:hypothetical protein